MILSLTRRRAVLLAAGTALVVVVVLALVTCRPPGGPQPPGTDPRPGAADRVRVEVEPPSAVRVDGRARTKLYPGGRAPLDLVLANPHPRAVVLAQVEVEVTSVEAPGASATLPCSTSDFEAGGGTIGRIRLPPGARTTLSEAGVARADWPHVAMVNTEQNQDGCKGATLQLAYGASGELV